MRIFLRAAFRFAVLGIILPLGSAVSNTRWAMLHLAQNAIIVVAISSYMVLSLLNVLWYLHDGHKIQKLRGHPDPRPGVILRK